MERKSLSYEEQVAEKIVVTYSGEKKVILMKKFFDGQGSFERC